MTPESRSAWSMAEDWVAAWNAADLDAIMEQCAPLVSFSSPGVVERWDMVDGWLHGWDALRMHFARGLENTSLALTLEDVLVGVGAVTIIYRRETGTRVSDCMELDDKGRARRIVVTYGQPSGDTVPLDA